jgi:hypothetical protein
MKYIISESHFNHYVRIISEQEEDLNDYDDEDFIEVFFEYFRPWVKSTHGDDAGKYPMSYLLKKYYIEFCRYIGLEVDDDDDYYGYSQLSNIGRQFVTSRQHKLPTLRPSVKFTEKYARQIEHIIRMLKLPEWLTVSFEELSPYNVEMSLNVDFTGMMRSKDESEKTPNDYGTEFEEYLTKYMGVEIGNPSHGQLYFSFVSRLNNTDEFTNVNSQKKLKSQMKSMSLGQFIHSITISIKDTGLRVDLSFKRSSGFRTKQMVREDIQKLFTDLGYNGDKVRVNI